MKSTDPSEPKISRQGLVKMLNDRLREHNKHYRTKETYLSKERLFSFAANYYNSDYASSYRIRSRYFSDDGDLSFLKEVEKNKWRAHNRKSDIELHGEAEWNKFLSCKYYTQQDVEGLKAEGELKYNEPQDIYEADEANMLKNYGIKNPDQLENYLHGDYIVVKNINKPELFMIIQLAAAKAA